jgi:3'-5' exoribonuclease
MNGSDNPGVTIVPVKDLKTGDMILQFFLIRSKDPRRTRSGQDYIDLSLSDATGTISGKMWSDAIRKWGHDFGSGDCVKIEGRVETYKEQSQIVIDKIRRADLSEVPDEIALVRKAPLEPDLMMAELQKIASSLEPMELSNLVLAMLDRHAELLKYFPAARVVHHAYQSGLLEHIFNVTKKVQVILPLEPKANPNVTIAGAILHDIGKLRELENNQNNRTLEGKLVGHIVSGIKMLNEIGSELKVTNELWFTEIEHIILSHHGEIQFGAPIKPFTREAMIVYFMDNLDAKLKIIDESLEQADSDGFGPYNKWLEGRAYSGTKEPQEREDDRDPIETC